MPSIRLTAHAAEMLGDREIAFDWVRETLEAPDREEPDPRNPWLTRSFRAIPEAEGRILRVVHRRDGADVLVITAHFDRGARR